MKSARDKERDAFIRAWSNGTSMFLAAAIIGVGGTAWELAALGAIYIIVALATIVCRFRRSNRSNY